MFRAIDPKSRKKSRPAFLQCAALCGLVLAPFLGLTTEAQAGWSRVPGGLRLDGEIKAIDYGAFLHHFEAAMLEEPRHAPIAIWLAGTGGDETAAYRIAEILAVAQEHGVRLATVMAQGHSCDGACFILYALGDEQIAAASGTRLIVGN
ncbi:hypothetical protein [Tritonibacter horizontis]|uniref:Uncharacterized protein n=1 Tax=Tritonibacter horizontis TaxID=1768241 RepID=A0A132BX03_9RHOB|nr:hypothetical protein [Tritonibacter horizontis]KUP92726.1 hypothetical protein TRIHO_23830 [Tritonibacter horizontis]